TTLYVTHDQEEAMALSDRVVVMDKGRALQVGAPEEVYRRPASRTVAAFFGTPNFIEAKVTASRANGRDHVLSIEGAGTRGDCRAAEAHRPGDAVLVMIRPEDVTLGAAGPLSWQGKVVDGVFRGPRRTLTVEAQGGGQGRRFTVECLGVEALDGAPARTGCQEARSERLRAGLPRGLCAGLARAARLRQAAQP